MKKLIVAILIIATLCLTEGCRQAVSTDFGVDYGESSIYSEADMQEAIKVIVDEFGTWEGCVLHNIAYSSDDMCNGENIAWMNDLAEGRNLEADFTQCIMFTSNFHSPKNGGDAWNADEEYTNWQWWLARTDGGDWKLLTWGY